MKRINRYLRNRIHYIIGKRQGRDKHNGTDSNHITWDLKEEGMDDTM